MTIKELISALGPAAGKDFAARQVRYLITQGIIPGPGGTRHEPEYSSVHLEGIRRYLKLKEAGLSVVTIRRLSEGLDYKVAPGITLSITPSDLPPGMNADEITIAVAELIANWTK